MTDVDVVHLQHEHAAFKCALESILRQIMTPDGSNDPDDILEGIVCTAEQALERYRRCS
jgi:hypothetical protein